MRRATLAQLVADRSARRPAVLATRLATQMEPFDQNILYPLEAQEESAMLAAAAAALKHDRAEVHALDGEEWFFTPFNPPLRLAILGAVHIAQPLSRMASDAGYDVTIIDPRLAFADPEKFPGVTLRTGWPQEEITAFTPDRRTAVVALTHDPKMDDPALLAALESPCFYIGALGSRKTHARRIERLRADGVSDDALGRIHAPVGLAIGARGPAEIAIAILAQITQVLRQ